MGGPDFPGTLGISRNALHAILLDAAGTAGVAIRTGVSVDRFASDPNGVSVRFTHGKEAHYDLMVAADGAHSGIRSQLFPGIKPAFCGQAVWRAGIPRPEETITTELFVGGPFGIVGICPIAADEAYLYIVEAADNGTRYAESDLAALMIEKLEPYTASQVREGVAHLPQSVGISYRSLEWLLLPPPWHRDRVLVIGDAAHCNPPVLAQGAAMGIEDAVVLAESLADAATIEEALEQFTPRRVPRASLVVHNSVQLCEWEVKHMVGPKEMGRLMTETQQALAQPF
jgi:2-polyprenyl-6-methoxyphenol hydroxylase-like FAD-dependent oxidoreductase